MIATVIPFDIYDEAVVVDRFISLAKEIWRGVDVGISAHNGAEAVQGYPPASDKDILTVLADLVLDRFGVAGLAELNRQASLLIKAGFGVADGDRRPRNGAQADGGTDGGRPKFMSDDSSGLEGPRVHLADPKNGEWGLRSVILYEGLHMAAHPNGNGFIAIRAGYRPLWLRHGDDCSLEVVDVTAF
jgi:hypothetical protein